MGHAMSERVRVEGRNSAVSEYLTLNRIREAGTAFEPSWTLPLPVQVVSPALSAVDLHVKSFAFNPRSAGAAAILILAAGAALCRRRDCGQRLILSSLLSSASL